MSRRRVLPLALLLLLLLVGGGGVAGLVLTSRDRADRTTTPERETSASGAGERDDATPPRPTRRERVKRVAAGDGASGDGDAASGPDEEGAATDETATKAEPAPLGAAAGAEPGADDRVLVRGRVVDGATDAGLSDARILVCRPGHGWYGTRTDESGAFEGRAPAATDDGAGVELRIAKKGYRTTVVPWSEGPVAARLERLDHDPQPGTIEGLATDPSGTPLPGRLLLTTYDEMGDHHGLWVLADASGAFRLEGLAPGWWKLRLVGGDAWVESVVPDGGSTRVHVIGGAEPWPGTMTEEEFLIRHRDLRRGRPPGSTDEALSDDQRQALAWQHILAVQDLECRWRGIRPARRVSITGLPDGAVHARAATTNGPNHSWRARVVDGVAEFPALTFERWRLVAERADGSEAQRTVDVTEGDGVLTVAWASE